MQALSHFNTLFVGDPKSTINNYCAALTSEDRVVSTTVSFSDANNQLQKNKYDIIIIDLDSFSTNQTTLKYILKIRRQKSELPFLFFSSKPDDGFLKGLGKNFGGYNYVVKPINYNLFILKINNLLQLGKPNIELKKIRKTLEKKAIRAEISYQDLFYSLPQEIILINLEGTVVTINRKKELCFGAKVNDLLNKHFSKSKYLNEILDKTTDLYKFLRLLKEEDESRTKEFSFVKPNKATVFTSVSYSIMIISNKIHIQLTVLDITERKKSDLTAELHFKEIESFDHINRALLNGDSLHKISETLLDVLDQTNGIKSSRIFLFDKKNNKLNLLAEHIEENLILKIEKKTGLKLSEIIPDINKGKLLETILLNGRPFVTSNPNEIKEIIAEHTNNLVLKKLAGWAQKIINSHTFGVFPLTQEGSLIGLITFSSVKVLSEKEIERLIRFSFHANTVLGKKLNEKLLLENEERFKLAMEGANDGLWDWNVLTNETYFSARWKGMLGYKEDELKNVQETWQNLIHPDDKENAIKIVNDYLIGKRSVYESEFRLRHKNGNYVYVLDRGIGIKDKKGKIIRMTGTHVDITERKINDFFLKQINDSLSVRTGPSYFSEFTKFCCETLGVKYAFVGEYFKDLNYVETISFHSNGKELEPFEYCLLHTPFEKINNGDACVFPKNVQAEFPKDTDLKTFGIESYLGIPLMNENNVPIGIIVLLHDKPMVDIENKISLLKILSSRTANELSRVIIDKKLRQSEERYRGLFEKMHEGLLLTSKEKVLLMVNSRFCEMMGYKAEEILGKSGYHLFHDEEAREKIIEKITDREKGISEQYEIEFITKSGKKIWTHVSSSPHYDSDGKFSGVMSIISDISERKSNEIKLQKTVEELNNRNNELMQFNYIVSHNLRSPIANIMGLVNVANLPNISTDEKSKIPEYIRESANKMDQLVKDLSIILTARSTINYKKESVSINQIIQSNKALLESQIIESDTVIKTEILSSNDKIITIRSYMESILYNLISNAIKYKSPERTPEIIISTKKENGTFILTVADNGIGIDLKRHENQVFGLYKRFNYDVEGKGLGLHMTKTQVEALGGKINVESVFGKGTKFFIIFNTTN